ncbi:unnamed protein product [Prunus armeniaca]
MFFRHYTKRSVAQWQVVLRRTYPWFQPGYRLFKKELEEEVARIDFRKKFLSVTLPRDLPHGGGKPPNYNLRAEVYHPNFCARQLDDLGVHKDARCVVNKINNSADALYTSWEPNSYSSAEFDAWWKARFQGLPASRIVLKTIKGINAQVIEGGQSIQIGEVIDLELPSGEEEDEILAEQPTVEATPSARRKKKEIAFAQDSAAHLEAFAESPPPPPPSTKSKRLRKRIVVEYVAMEEPRAAPTNTSGTDEELREAFEAVGKEKELEEEGPQEKEKEVEEEEEIPAEVIAERIALVQKQQEGPRAELTSSESALFEDAEAEHSTAAEQSVSEPVEQAELPVAASEPKVELTAVVPGLVLEVPRTTVVLAVMTSPFKPPIVAMPIHYFPGSSTTASFADSKLAEFEAMDLDAQLDKLEKLSSTPGKAKFKAVKEAMERLKIWQSTELELDEDREVVDQLMKDLDLLHRQNMAPKPLLEISLGLARDVLNLHDRYEDLKPTFKTSEFCKATHEANLADYAKQKAELDHYRQAGEAD